MTHDHGSGGDAGGYHDSGSHHDSSSHGHHDSGSHHHDSGSNDHHSGHHSTQQETPHHSNSHHWHHHHPEDQSSSGGTHDQAKHDIKHMDDRQTADDYFATSTVLDTTTSNNANVEPVSAIKHKESLYKKNKRPPTPMSFPKNILRRLSKDAGTGKKEKEKENDGDKKTVETKEQTDEPGAKVEAEAEKQRRGSTGLKKFFGSAKNIFTPKAHEKNEEGEEKAEVEQGEEAAKSTEEPGQQPTVGQAPETTTN